MTSLNQNVSILRRSHERLPGSFSITLALQTREATPARRKELRRELHMSGPILRQNLPRSNCIRHGTADITEPSGLNVHGFLPTCLGHAEEREGEALVS